MPIEVCVIEDNRDTRESLVRIIGEATELHCAGSFSTAEAALQGVPAAKPDVALVDINLPGMSGIECVAQLTAIMPQLQVLMLTMYEERDLIFNSLRAGAKGYLLKKTPAPELVQAVEQVHAGGAPMSMQIARKVVDHFGRIDNPKSDFEKLTRREETILELLAKGALYKEIADQLGISLSTVKGHVQHIYEKLHVQSRAEAKERFLRGE